jgi:hypothetical protein
LHPGGRFLEEAVGCDAEHADGHAVGERSEHDERNRVEP